MKKLTTLAAMAGTVLLFAARSAQADLANGSYYVDAGSFVPVWDLSEYYDSDVGIGGLEFDLVQEPSGSFTGSGDLYIDDLGVSLDMPAVVSGKVTGSSTDPKISMEVLASYSGDYDGAAYFNYLDATLKLAMQVDSADAQVAGQGSGTVKYSIQVYSTGKTEKGSKSASTGSVAFPLPDDVDGDWNLTLNLTPEAVTSKGAKYTGTATVVTSPGTTVNFTATGTYTSKTDTSNITLKGDGCSLNLVISTSGSTLTIQSVKGKLFGQSLNYKAP